MSPESPPSEAAVTETLARLLDYTPAMLSENRAGRLHPDQVAHFHVQIYAYLVKGMIFAVPLLSLAAFLGPTGAPAAVPFALCLTFFGLLALVGFGGLAWNRHTKVTTRAVASLSGPIAKKKEFLSRASERRNQPTYSFAIQGTEFIISPAVYQALAQGVYTVYFFAGTTELLSLEMLSKE